MSRHAVFLDAMGTLVHCPHPERRLTALLDDAGYPHPESQVAAALHAEIAYYRQHLHEGRDPDSLADLRRRCVAVLSEGLDRPPPPDRLHDLLLEALRFEVYPEVPTVLATLARMGCVRVVVSNWDCSLPEVFATVGLGAAFSGVIASGAIGHAKPDPAIFAQACAAAGVDPGDALHCGDDPVADYQGAIGAGCAAVLLDRHGAARRDPPTITTLVDLPARVAAWRQGRGSSGSVPRRCPPWTPTRARAIRGPCWWSWSSWSC